MVCNGFIRRKFIASILYSVLTIYRYHKSSRGCAWCAGAHLPQGEATWLPFWAEYAAVTGMQQAELKNFDPLFPPHLPRLAA